MPQTHLSTLGKPSKELPLSPPLADEEADA